MVNKLPHTELNKISHADRVEIVSQFSASFEDGATKEVLDYVRREIEAKFCPHTYSERQVNAVCSQVIIQKNRMLEITKNLSTDKGSSMRQNRLMRNVGPTQTQSVSSHEIGESSNCAMPTSGATPKAMGRDSAFSYTLPVSSNGICFMISKTL